MSDKDIAIKVKNISKRYRIGLKEEISDSIGGAIISFMKSPWNNFQKYRSLYRFDNVSLDKNSNQFHNSSDIIWALKNVSFEVHKGEIVGIIGANGAGKSTLLKIMSRITDPTLGQIELRGRLSSLLEVGTGFHPELTGKENIYLNGTILGMRKKEIDLKFDEIVDFSGVEKFIDTPVKRYSSGMRVRLAFAVAAHLEPDILLIDEVLAVGDIKFQNKCLNKMEEIQGEGRTVLFVSHNMQAVSRLCPRSILLNDGRMFLDGPSHKTVSAYLETEIGRVAEREWQDQNEAPGDEVVRLCAVRVRTQDGKISDAMDIHKPIAIEIEYEVLLSGYTLNPYFHVHNENGLKLFESHENDSVWRGKSRPAGRYISTAWIPGDFLSEGIIKISTSLRTMNPVFRRFRVDNAVTFQVVDNNSRGEYNQYLGVVRPLLKWKNDFIPTKDVT